MQFGRQQLEQLQRVWVPGFWFFDALEPLHREIIAKAYYLHSAPQVSKREAYWCQVIVDLALDSFSQKLDTPKSHIVHALLSGSQGHTAQIIAQAHANFYNLGRSASELLRKSFREAIEHAKD